MTRQGYISDADDVMLDIERIDEENRGVLTAVKAHTIERMHTRHQASLESIASMLCLDVALVNEVIARLEERRV